MSFKDYDKKTFIADTARDFAARRISKRDFLQEDRHGRRRLLGLRVGLLGNTRRFRGDQPDRRLRPSRRTPSDQVAEGCRLALQGHQDPLHLGSNAADRRSRQAQGASSPNRPASKSKSRSCRSSRFSPRRRRTCRASSAPTTSTISTSPGSRPSPRTRSTPCQYYKDKPDLAMPGFDWDDFSKPLVDGLALYEGKWVGIPFDIPIFMHDVPQGHPREAQDRSADHAWRNSPPRSSRSPRPRRPTACSAPASRPSPATIR